MGLKEFRGVIEAITKSGSNKFHGSQRGGARNATFNQEVYLTRHDDFTLKATGLGPPEHEMAEDTYILSRSNGRRYEASEGHAQIGPRAECPAILDRKTFNWPPGTAMRRDANRSCHGRQETYARDHSQDGEVRARRQGIAGLR